MPSLSLSLRVCLPRSLYLSSSSSSCSWLAFVQPPSSSSSSSSPFLIACSQSCLYVWNLLSLSVWWSYRLPLLGFLHSLFFFVFFFNPHSTRCCIICFSLLHVLSLSHSACFFFFVCAATLQIHTHTRTQLVTKLFFCFLFAFCASIIFCLPFFFYIVLCVIVMCMLLVWRTHY